jgi:hypothetical protein
MLEAKIRDLFEELATSDQPPAKVSIAAATQRGRSLLRWRRVRIAGTPVLAASAVMAVALTGALPIGTSVQPSQLPAPGLASAPDHQSAGAGRAVPANRAAPAPAQFSPLKPYASFGWLPAGESATSGGTGRIQQLLNASAGRHLTWQLSVYAAGDCGLTRHSKALVCHLGSAGGLNAPLAGRAPAVNGRPTFWLSSSPSATPVNMRHQSVVWQYAPGGWAQLSNATDTPNPASTPIRVASGVVFGGAGQQIEFAAQLTRVPANWHVSSVSFGWTNGVMRATGYSVTKGSLRIGAGDGVVETDLPSITTDLRPGSCYFYPGGQSVHRVINGYRAVVNTIPAQRGGSLTRQVCVPNANGLLIFVSVIGPHPAIDPVTLFQHMKVLGTNPADWTMLPIG